MYIEDGRPAVVEVNMSTSIAGSGLGPCEDKSLALVVRCRDVVGHYPSVVFINME